VGIQKPRPKTEGAARLSGVGDQRRCKARGASQGSEMAADITAYRTKELSKKTSPDFVKLFSPASGWQHCWCVHFHRRCSLPKSEWLNTLAERGVRNRREQRMMVERGRSHGIIVYVDGEPVGW
jgi:hypothetical protein